MKVMRRITALLKKFKTPKLQFALGFSVVTLLSVILGIVKFIQISAAMAQHAGGPPPEAVTTMLVANAPWQKTIEAVGTLVPSQGVTLAAEEAGKVSKISFESGDQVEAGTILVELDTTVEDAELRGAEATQKRALEDLERAKILRKKNVMSEADLDRANAEATEATSKVESLRATIARKRIIAPFSGRTGIRKVNLGQYLTPGVEVVPLHVLDPLYLNFSLPQREAASVSKGLTVQLSIAGLDASVEGRIHALDPQLNQETRLLDVQATVPNASGELRPGMFAKVQVVLPESDRLIAVPTSSISYAPYGDMVWVVEKLKGPNGDEYSGVRQQVVKLGGRRGNQIAVLTGLKEGEEIVTSGTFKLRPGAAIVVRNELAPPNDAEPKPSES